MKQELAMKAYISILCLICSFSTGVMADEDTKSLEQEAQKLIKSFSQALKFELKSAISTGGLEAGVKVCNLQAPVISQQVSQQGWSVQRTSLRTRNKHNEPDQWEYQTLLEFEQSKKDGSKISQLIKTEKTDKDFRYMKAIPTAGLCLACHGSDISPEVKKVIDRHYPNDSAVNFKLGDIRGAFTLLKELSKAE